MGSLFHGFMGSLFHGYIDSLFHGFMVPRLSPCGQQSSNQTIQQFLKINRIRHRAAAFHQF
jgi:hypothetical protein